MGGRESEKQTKTEEVRSKEISRVIAYPFFPIMYTQRRKDVDKEAAEQILLLDEVTNSGKERTV